LIMVAKTSYPGSLNKQAQKFCLGRRTTTSPTFLSYSRDCMLTCSLH